MQAGTHSEARVLLACSSGGHLAQMYELAPWWRRHRRLWVTFDTPDSVSLLAGEVVVWCHHPTTRNLTNLVRNFILAAKLLREHDIDLIVSTGAAIAVPFFVLARLKGIPTVYIEAADRVTGLPTLTGRICHPLASSFLLQLPEQQGAFPRGRVIGPLL